MSLYDFPGFLACSVAVFVLASCIHRKHVRNLRLFLLAVALLIGGLVLQEIVELVHPPTSMLMAMTMTPTAPTPTPRALVYLSVLSRWTMYASLPVFALACIGGAGAYAQCSKCGYNLTGNESGTCPECGEHLSSDV